MNKNYITLDGSFNPEPFFAIPQALFKGKYKALSLTAKLLYTLLLDRLNASEENNSSDKKIDFILFIRKEAAQMLNVTSCTISKVFKELSDFSLIEDVKQGKQMPNKIYVLKPDETKKSEVIIPQ